MNNLRKKFRNRELVFGTWTSFGHPQITEIFARSGCDFVGIDIEHSTISLEQSLRIIEAAQSLGVACLPRIASHNMEMIKRLLDSGANGLIVPMVSTPEEVSNLVKWSKFSPVGNRSFGIARAQGYGFDFDQYIKEWNEKSSMIVQIESQEGVKNIDQILKNDSVDGAMIGPYDLSGSMGIPGQLDHPKIKEACKIVIEACKKHNKTSGTQVIEPDQNSIQEKIKEGFNMIVLASDIFLLWKWSARIKDLTKSFHK